MSTTRKRRDPVGEGQGGTRQILPREARALLVGINPSLASGHSGHNFAGPGNPFWRLLHASGLTPCLLRPDEDERLAAHGLGLTNLCARPTRAASELTRSEIETGRRTLAALIPDLAPRVVAFVGVSVYKDFFRLKISGGAGAKPETIGSARVFVVPNPSGLNASYPGFQDKLVWFQALRRYIDEGAA